MPTGIKTGVSTSPWRRLMTPTLALVVVHFAITLYFSGGSLLADKLQLFGMDEANWVDIIWNKARAFFNISFNSFNLFIYWFVQLKLKHKSIKNAERHKNIVNESVLIELINKHEVYVCTSLQRILLTKARCHKCTLNRLRCKHDTIHSDRTVIMACLQWPIQTLKSKRFSSKILFQSNSYYLVKCKIHWKKIWKCF